MGGQVVKRHLNKLLVGGDGLRFEWETRTLQRNNPLKAVI